MRNSRIFHNAKWIILCKIAQSLLQLVVGMLSARYLGPSNYGLISYAGSVVAFMVPVMQLGLSATLVRELADDPQKEGEILGTALLMNLLSGLCCMVLVVGFVSVANQGENETLIVCGLYSLSLLFLALEITQYWFHSKLQSKYPSIMMLIAYVVVSAYKLYLLASEKSVYWFAVAHSVECGVIGIGLLLIYRRLGMQRLTVSTAMARKLLSRSKYYVLSSLMVMAYKNTDHIMLKTMIGDVENGLYTAAATASGVAHFIYMAIIDSARPVILAEKKKKQRQFEQRISQLYTVIIGMALVQSLLFTLCAKLIIGILYGADYAGSIVVLRILVWQIPFSLMGSVRNVWILAEEKHKRLWRINLCGVLANVVLNACFIPHWGGRGAAAASVLTQFFTNFIVGFLMKEIRPNNRLMLTGLKPKFIWNALREGLNIIRQTDGL